MKAVILAAGVCSRIRSVTELPKCLLRFDGRSILDYQLERLRSAGVNEFAIVVGYKANEIVAQVLRSHPAMLSDITFIENPEFARTNNIYSLYCAREWIGNSKTLVLNADVIFHPDIILPAVKTTANLSMIVDKVFREETMKVIIRNGQVIAMRKGIPEEESSGTYIGVTTVSASAMGRLINEVENLIATGHEREFFNAAVERLVAMGVPVSYTWTAGLPWTEIDDPNDYRLALQTEWGAMHTGDTTTGLQAWHTEIKARVMPSSDPR